MVLNPMIKQVGINLHTKYELVVEKSLMKNVILQSMDGKKIGQIQGRIRRLVPKPTLQQVIMNLATKYDHSSLQSS